jgi:hypothetical protein
MKDNFEIIKKELDSINTMGFIDKEASELKMDEYKSGKMNDYSMFWRVLVFGRWIKKLN